MSKFQDKINNLEPVYPPIEVKTFREEVNKIVEVLKEFPQLASIQDVEDIQNIIYPNYKKSIRKVEGGYSRENYTEEDIIDFGNSNTINTYIGFRWGAFNYSRFLLKANSSNSIFQLVQVESNTSWKLESRNKSANIEISPIEGFGNKLLLIKYDLNIPIKTNNIKKKRTYKKKIKILSSDEGIMPMSENKITIMTLSINKVVLNKKINKEEIQIRFTDKLFSVTAETNPINKGIITGTGQYKYQEYVELLVSSDYPYQFEEWNDGDKSNPKKFYVENNINYIAKLIEYYTITVICSPSHCGIVSGGGTFVPNTQITLNAQSYSESYIFDGWYLNGVKVSSDLNFKITVTQDAIYEAKFYYETSFYLILKDLKSNKIFDVTTIFFSELPLDNHLILNKNLIRLSKTNDSDKLYIQTNLNWNLII